MGGAVGAADGVEVVVSVGLGVSTGAGVVVAAATPGGVGWGKIPMLSAGAGVVDGVGWLLASTILSW